MSAVKTAGAGIVFSHAFSGELKAVSIVNEAIQDGIAKGGIAYDIMPVFHGNLACDDCGSAAMAIVEDLQDVSPFSRTNGYRLASAHEPDFD